MLVGVWVREYGSRCCGLRWVFGWSLVRYGSFFVRAVVSIAVLVTLASIIGLASVPGNLFVAGTVMGPVGGWWRRWSVLFSGIGWVWWVVSSCVFLVVWVWWVVGFVCAVTRLLGLGWVWLLLAVGGGGQDCCAGEISVFSVFLVVGTRWGRRTCPCCRNFFVRPGCGLVGFCVVFGS